MKKGLLLSGAIGLLALGLASCSSDEPLGYQDQKVEKSETRYLSVALCNPTSNSSRAGEFQVGTEQENNIQTLIFVFYDGSGAPVGTPVNLGANDLTEGWTDGGPAADKDEDNVGKFWQSTIPVAMSQGENKPVYVMCYVNPIDQEGLTTMTIDEVEEAQRSRVITGAGNFAMSNSVFYGDNPITGQGDVRMMATPIVGDILAPTPEDAIKNPAVNIYVERYAAKLSLQMAPGALTNGYPVVMADGTSSKIVFTPTYWRTNAVDRTTFITKGFNVPGQGGNVGDPATFAQMNSAFRGSNMEGEGLGGWNDPDNHRSYWACSPSYYVSSYPSCSDDVLQAEEANTPYAVKYYTYNEIANDADANNKPVAWSTENGFQSSSFFYSRETTAAIDMLRGQTSVNGTTTNIPNFNNKAVPASIVIVGNYKVGTSTTNSTFYLYGKKNNKDVCYTSEGSVKNALIANQHVIFSDDAGTTYATNPANFIIAHPSKEVRTIPNDEEGGETVEEKVPGRLVTIQIDKNNIPANLYFYNGDQIVPVSDDINAANRLLWKSASTAQMFYNGLAFFAIPIRHLGWDDAVDLIEDAADTGRPYSINWPNLRIGDLGMVRNHVYSYTVTSVTGLGIGLSGVDQPIVPPMDPDDYYISVKLNILSWRVVPTSTVTL